MDALWFRQKTQDGQEESHRNALQHHAQKKSERNANSSRSRSRSRSLSSNHASNGSTSTSTSKPGRKKIALSGTTVTVRKLTARPALYVITVLIYHGFSIAAHQLQDIILHSITWINYQNRNILSLILKLKGQKEQHLPPNYQPDLRQQVPL